MDEVQARAWLAGALGVSRETMQRLETLAELLRQENEAQNLIAASTVPHLWSRHILDSAQLLLFDPDAKADWLDLGTGAGFPGLVVAAIRSGPVTLVEQRRLRAQFLERAVAAMGIEDRCRVLCSRVERVEQHRYAAISARAFAPLPALLDVAERFSTAKTRWILPKGRNAQAELEQAASSWQGVFRLEPSLTDAEARIIVAEQVRRRKGQRR